MSDLRADKVRRESEEGSPQAGRDGRSTIVTCGSASEPLYHPDRRVHKQNLPRVRNLRET